MKCGKWPSLYDVTVGYYWPDHTSEGRLFVLGDPDWSSHDHVDGWTWLDVRNDNDVDDWENFPCGQATENLERETIDKEGLLYWKY